ncbi:MAG: hypothetical protein HC941_07710 [Microcoleus sp. SU_5_3]|nr:hypothetical protein [Microcoleus sp. SU_5_3]
MNQQQLRTKVLVDCGAGDSEMAELLAYNQNVFDFNSVKLPQIFPLTSEPGVAAWEKYAAATETAGVYEVLKECLIQFQFPILAGISETEEYRAATRKGKLPDESAIAIPLTFAEPEKLQIQLHQTLAGTIPVLIAANREDFVILVQALTKRNEPQPIPDSMGACTISGYNNWNRIEQYKQQWICQQHKYSETDWEAEFKRLIKRKELYQDRLIILSPGPYSNVTASNLGLTETEWGQLSLKIRLEHESTHYLTRRFFGSMRNNMIDELIADYRGIVAALGYYRSDWFLHFIGLESFPTYRKGGRLENYRGEPALSDSAFKILQILVKKAAENLDRFDKQFCQHQRTPLEQVSAMITLTALTLEELADDSAEFMQKIAASANFAAAK